MEYQTPKEQYEARKREKEAERGAGASRARVWRSVLTWGGAGVFIVLSIWGIVALGGSSTGGNGTASLLDAISSRDRAQGDIGAQVALVEYGDYQCPACAYYNQFTSDLVAEFGDKIVFVYRHFPLRSIHANADLAARAAEAAGVQGKYWDMHELLYKNQTSWEAAGNAKEIFTRYATSLKLNAAQFERDVESETLKEKVQSDYESGVRAEVSGTPTFFLNGEKIENPSSYQAFSALVASALLEASRNSSSSPIQ